MNTFLLVDWWNSLQTAHQIFWAIAIIASVLFLLQSIGTLMGLNAETDYEIDFDSDFDVDAEGHFSIDPAFTVFSIRSIIAFFVFFGWAGVVLLNQGEPITKVLVVSFVSGIVALFFVAYVLFKMTQMADSGNVVFSDLIDKQARVYLTIPSNRQGEGLITVTIGDREMELKAVTDEDKNIKTGKIVKIIEVLDQKFLVESLK